MSEYVNNSNTVKLTIESSDLTAVSWTHFSSNTHKHRQAYTHTSIMVNWAVVSWLGNMFTPCSHCQQQTNYTVDITWHTKNRTNAQTYSNVQCGQDGRIVPLHYQSYQQIVKSIYNHRCKDCTTCIHRHIYIDTYLISLNKEFQCWSCRVTLEVSPELIVKIPLNIRIQIKYHLRDASMFHTWWAIITW